MKFYKLTSLLVVPCLALAFASCSDDDDNNTITPATNITAMIDADFAQKLADARIIPSATEIYDSTVRKVTMINLPGNPLSTTDGKLTSLKGIEYFTELEILVVKSQALTSLDLSRNTDLKQLDVANNKLTSLILPNGDDDLKILGCGQNQLTELNLRGFDELTHLDCSENKIASLDLRDLASLQTFYCNRNMLTAIDVSQSPRLAVFGCEDNPGVADTLVVKTACNPTQIPEHFTNTSWTFDGRTVSVKYVK